MIVNRLFRYRNISVTFKNLVTKLNYCKSVTGDKYVRLEADSLQVRLLNYLGALTENGAHIPPVNNVPTDDLSAFNKHDLGRAIKYLVVSPEITTARHFNHELSKLDKECCARLLQLSTNEIFQYLNNFMQEIPHVLIKLKFYSEALERLKLNAPNFSKGELVNFCFFASFSKRSNNFKHILKSCFGKFKYINSDALTVNDIVVLCSSSFKTSIKIDRQTLKKIVDFLYADLSILDDPPLFISIVKTLRLNRYYDEDLLGTISNTIFFNKTVKHYNFTANTHILAIYADGLYYDRKLIRLLCDSCVRQLRDAKPFVSKNEHFSKQIRLKDLSRFLWSLSYIGHALDKNLIDHYIMPLWMDHLSDKKEHHIDILLSLWIMQYYPLQVLPQVLTADTIDTIDKKGKQRLAARLNLLLTCVSLESKEAYLKLDLPVGQPMPLNAPAQLDKRPHLAKVFRCLGRLSQQYKIGNVRCEAVIPHLNILGISCLDAGDRPLFVEVVDEFVSAYNVHGNTFVPHGLMSLKLRLLKSFNNKILIITNEDVEDLSENELEGFLKRKLTRLLRV